MIEASQIAEVLAAAERDRKELNPFTDEHPDLDVQTAYDAQWAGIERRLAAGERLVAAKLGLTSKAKQRVMNVDAPLYGWVTDRMLLPYGEPVDLSRFIHPRVEPEIAFLLARPVAAPATVTSVLAATEAIPTPRAVAARATRPAAVATIATAKASRHQRALLGAQIVQLLLLRRVRLQDRVDLLAVFVGHLHAAAEATALTEAALTALLYDAGIRATHAVGGDGRVAVLVFAEQVEEARRLVGDSPAL